MRLTGAMLLLALTAAMSGFHGAAAARPAVMRGEIQLSNSNVASNIGAIRAGQIKAFAVTSARPAYRPVRTVQGRNCGSPTRILKAR